MNMYFDGDERRGFSGEKVLDEAILADEGHGVGVVILKELQQLIGIGQLFENVKGHEERHGPGAILVGQCDHHETPSRPDVQVTLVHGELSPWKSVIIISSNN